MEPHRRYNWLTTELIQWNGFDGRPSRGILYKPENFDSSKKYPIIFYFYEQLSPGLNKYVNADFSIGPMNIPFFVSNEYLVFCPDIYYDVGKVGESAYNFVVSAAKKMMNYRWVNSEKDGYSRT